MPSKLSVRARIFIPRVAAAALVIAIMLALTVVSTQSAQAQTFKVIHTFTGGGDGANPPAGLTIDQAGNLYGTTQVGGSGNGTVFRLSKKGSTWILTPLYTFAGGTDGALPLSRVLFGPDDKLYSTTYAGGGNDDPGTVFNLEPPVTACKTALCPWTETVLYRFTGGDGANPGMADLTFDQAGNLYGTTLEGGSGTVFELAPSNGGWTESVLYAFMGGSDGAHPEAGVTFDQAGNLYGTTLEGGGYGYGVAYQLSPSGTGWTENVLYTFQGGNDGASPYAGLIFDSAGNLYGSAALGGTGSGGTVFELTPSNGSWTLKTLYSFTGNGGSGANLVMDGAGNLYGTTVYDGAYGGGSVFELTHSGGIWTYASLHDFTGGSDGLWPVSNVTFDANGNLYGTAFTGGASGCAEPYGCGVVWEITP